MQFTPVTPSRWGKGEKAQNIDDNFPDHRAVPLWSWKFHSPNGYNRCLTNTNIIASQSIALWSGLNLDHFMFKCNKQSYTITSIMNTNAKRPLLLYSSAPTREADSLQRCTQEYNKHLNYIILKVR